MGRIGQSFYSLCETSVGHKAARATVRLMRRCGMLCNFRLPLDALSLEHDAVRELMRLWARIHWAAGDGMMPPEQLLAVYRLAATWPVEGATVELGAWVGLTTSYLAAACRSRGGGRVYAVDTFEGTKEGGEQYRSVARFGGSTMAAFRSQIHRAGVADLVEPLVGYTQHVAGRYGGAPIRLLLIDADHSYEGVRRDFERWSPLVAPGGLIVFHDYLMPDVARFVDQDVQANETVEPAPGLVESNVFAVTKRPVATATRVRSADRVSIERRELAGVAVG